MAVVARAYSSIMWTRIHRIDTCLPSRLPSERASGDPAAVAIRARRIALWRQARTPPPRSPRRRRRSHRRDRRPSGGSAPRPPRPRTCAGTRTARPRPCAGPGRAATSRRAARTARRAAPRSARSTCAPASPVRSRATASSIGPSSRMYGGSTRSAAIPTALPPFERGTRHSGHRPVAEKCW